MGVTRKERLLKAMLEDNAEACRGGVSREERIIAGVSKKVCDNDALEGGGTGGGGSGGGLPTGCDPNMMLVTDADGNAKWEERTHYEELLEGEILPENTPTFNADAGSFMVFEPLATEIVLGNTYTVVWNGTPYTCTAKETEMSGYVCTFLGNGVAFGGDNTGEPFAFLVPPRRACRVWWRYFCNVYAV